MLYDGKKIIGIKKTNKQKTHPTYKNKMSKFSEIYLFSKFLSVVPF